MASFVRRDVWSVDAWDPIVLWYARAVRAMKDRDDDDPLSWTYQSAMHGTYTQPAEALWNGCQHGSWFFLPWHRIYIWYFEQIVRAAIADLGGPANWALPYWNYTDGATADHARLPAAFREPLLDGAPNPLFVDDGHRWPAVNAGAKLPDPVTSTKRAMDSAIFSPGFGGLPVGPVHYRTPHGLLESQPHDAVHGQVGGNVTKTGCHEGWMADPNCAASDPIFYLHHSNIDRLWVRWLGQAGGRANPTHPDWVGRKFTCFGADGVEHTKSCGDVADILQQDYRYDDMPAVPEPPAPEPEPEAVAPVPAAELPTPPGDGPEIAAGDGVELGAESTSVDLSRSAAAPPVLDAARGGEARIYLHLDGVHVDGMPGTIWQVRLDPDGPGGDPDRAVGTISFFGRGHAHGGDAADQAPGVHDERFIFDITDVVQELEAEGRWDEDAITVSFHPVAPEGADLAAVPTVTVNRVFITHG